MYYDIDFELPASTKALVAMKLSGQRGAAAAWMDMHERHTVSDCSQGKAVTPCEKPVLKPGPPLHPDHTREER